MHCGSCRLVAQQVCQQISRQGSQTEAAHRKRQPASTTHCLTHLFTRMSSLPCSCCTRATMSLRRSGQAAGQGNMNMRATKHESWPAAAVATASVRQQQQQKGCSSGVLHFPAATAAAEAMGAMHH